MGTCALSTPLDTSYEMIHRKHQLPLHTHALSMFDTRFIAECGPHTKLLIFGFLRRSVYVMPEMLAYVVMAYFNMHLQRWCHIHKFWSKQLKGANMSVQRNKKTIGISNETRTFLITGRRNTVYSDYTAYGAEHKTIVAEFLINTCYYASDYISIGIQLSKWSDGNGDFTNNKRGEFYAYCSDGTLKSHAHGSKSFAHRYGTNSVICMKLQFIPQCDFGRLFFKKIYSKSDRITQKWKDTQLKIDKYRPIKIAVSLYADKSHRGNSSLTFVSLKTKNN